MQSNRTAVLLAAMGLARQHGVPIERAIEAVERVGTVRTTPADPVVRPPSRNQRQLHNVLVNRAQKQAKRNRVKHARKCTNGRRARGGQGVF